MIHINISPSSRWPLIKILADKGFDVNEYSLYKPYLVFNNGNPYYVAEAKGNPVAYFDRSILAELELLPKEAIEIYIMSNLRYKP